MKNYLDYLENGSKINWFLRPIDVNEHPVKSSWISIFSDLFKKSENDNEKINAENNKATSVDSSKSRNNNVVNFTNRNGDGTYKNSIGNYGVRVTFKSHS